MSDNLVAYSRAGDVFHYRWAARRCLRLIYPNSSLQKIVIEGSAENEKAGEYVIDVTEYYEATNGKIKIAYYQLKHTTVQHDKPFTISDLEDTFIGFAKRFLQHKDKEASDFTNISFSIITNRKVDDTFKQKMISIAKNEVVDTRFKETIEKYTGLSSIDLSAFCSVVRLEDSEGDYNVQKRELRFELAQLMAGSIDNAQINNLVSLVQEKVLPDSDKCIKREDVLKRFGITSERDLYPAPAVLEELEKVIERKQHDILKESICNSPYPVIVHAAGGVGKSVFCQQFVKSLPEGSMGVVYDCFGAGSYRNRSGLRHSHRHALIQIANELSSQGLCDPLIVQDATLDEDIMRKFLLRIETSVKNLQKTNDTAQLFILIDAADNAEMAAKEFNQPCFAHELLREKIIDGCKLIFFCRTERISLLQPQSFIPELELEAFTIEETTENLKKWFLEANDNDGAEFHRLTAGNPRVQANALDGKHGTVNELLVSLGPSGTSVEKQIEIQLNAAISKMKDILPKEYRNHINSICLGLASLPPHIPIDVLSKAADVSVENVKSFVADIGRSLWLSDLSVQFRDEPTETWFRKTFLADKEIYENYISLLEPLACQSSYVAEVLPQLYLQAEQYDKLINIALSDDYLPENNPIDARNIRVQRLQFAFKAALKSQHLKDAVKLAMRAGEEVAGNQRQLTLLQKNIDLIPLLQNKEKVQEIAFKRWLSSNWDGSENIYTASLLSGITEYKGEARGYLRASINWLHIFFEEQKKNKNTLRHRDDGVTENDILELAFAQINIFDVKICLEFLLRLKPKSLIFRIMLELTKRLIDIGRFEEINELLHNCICEPYFIIAITHELIQVGKIPESSEIETCLDLLCSSRSRIKKPTFLYDDKVTPAIVSFLEACLHRNLSSRKILRVLTHYVPVKVSRMIYESPYPNERRVYLKALAIRMVLSEKTEIEIEKIYPEEFTGKKGSSAQDNEIKKIKEVILGLLPWYLLRAKILCGKDIKFLDVVNETDETSKKARVNRYRDHDTLPNEIAEICATILILYNTDNKDINEFYHHFLQNNDAFKVQYRLNALRSIYRTSHLSAIRQELELSTYELIKNCHNESPDELANRYTSLARAVLISSIDDACAYFDEAVTIVSKFGDEIAQRWDAIASLAQKASEMNIISKELAYRFIRCAELVGDNVSDERYWDRSGAMQVCTKMSPGVGISALSRWRDRDIGRFEDQFEAVLFELVESKVINSAIGWVLTRFFSQHERIKYLSVCLEKESSHMIKQRLFDDAVFLLQVEGTESAVWEDLKDIATKFELIHPQLNSIVDFYAKQEVDLPQNTDYKVKNELDNPPGNNWDDIFDGLIITSLDGFKKIVKRFELAQDKDEFKWHKRVFLEEALNRVDEKSIGDFIDVITLSEYIEYYDALNVFSIFSNKWKNKVSFKKKWPDIIFRLGERYAHDLTDKYSINHFADELRLNEDLIDKLKSGIFSGLARGGNEFTNADNFFGFVNLASSQIKAVEAMELVDYSLSRFELHIEDNFGDGRWDEWLYVSDNTNKNIAGFIWSALGSPRSVVRWNAAHCVRKLAELNCLDILDALFGWMEHDKVDAFGSKKFLFYNLHARQYLLIAFARISLEQPELLSKYKNVFIKYALLEPHILIQKYASGIALNLEKSFPGTYSESLIGSISNVGKSSAVIQEKDHNYITNSYWHERGEIVTDIDWHFAWDFDRYWYEPLGDVFGIPGGQIQDLAANVIVKEWGLAGCSGYRNDPRVILWNRSIHERETWHDHGSYPRTDNLDFYLSYHSMLVVAAWLIEKMPIIKKRDWPDDVWKDWLSRHLLTREDGKWLSDCRDPLPLIRPKWIFEKKNDTWQADITKDDFINCLQTKYNEDLWLNVRGGWQEKQNDRTETFSISSALVSKETSDALLRALTTCKDPYDYKLPYYEEDDAEIESGIFKLKGWINDPSFSKRLDESDPYADYIVYPPYSLGTNIIDRLKLTTANDGKFWYDSKSRLMALICEVWSSHRTNKDEEPEQSGMKLKASLSFLKDLCSTFDCNLIIDISIRRDISHRYDQERREYPKPQNKIFIFSSDGKLRSTDTSYQLG